MADEQPGTPKSIEQSFSELVTQWERNYDAFANQLMGTEGFSQTMNQMQKAQLLAQQSVTQNMSKQLAAMNMPTREDVLNLGDAVAQLDRRLERIEERLATNDAPASKRKRPARTRQPDTTAGKKKDKGVSK